MKIIFLNVAKRKYGGSVYEKMVAKILSGEFEVEIKNLSSNKVKFLWGLWKFSRRKDIDMVIRTFDTSLFMNQKPVKNIAIIHHIDHSFAPKLIKFTSPFFTRIILRNLRKFDAIVIASRYWENYFLERGYKNIFKIHNTFDNEKPAH